MTKQLIQLTARWDCSDAAVNEVYLALRVVVDTPCLVGRTLLDMCLGARATGLSAVLEHSPVTAVSSQEMGLVSARTAYNRSPRAPEDHEV